MANGDGETGYRWWLRYVVIPLVGSGGIIALWIGLRDPSPQNAPAALAAPAAAATAAPVPPPRQERKPSLLSPASQVPAPAERPIAERARPSDRLATSKDPEAQVTKGESTQGETVAGPDTFRGQLDLDSFCKSQYGGYFRGLMADNPRCADGAEAKPVSFAEACFWQFGSMLYEVELDSASVWCDTSKRTAFPCVDGQRFCGQDTKYCCPNS